MIPKDSFSRASLENLTQFKRASSFSNIPRPSSSSKKSKENENVLQFTQQQQQILLSQQLQQSQSNIMSSTGNLHKQQVVVSSIPLSFNQNISNSQMPLTQRGKEILFNQTNGIVSSSMISSQTSQLSSQKLTVNTSNSCQNTARNMSQTSTIAPQNSATKISSQSYNNIPNSARASSHKQLNQVQSTNNLSVATNSTNVSQPQIPINTSQPNTRLSSHNNTILQQAQVNNNQSNNNGGVNNNNNSNPSLYPQSTTKNLREILQSSTTKTNNIHSHRHSSQQQPVPPSSNKWQQQQVNDENASAGTSSQATAGLKQNNQNAQMINASSKRVLTTPSTIGGLDESYGYKDMNYYKKEILRMSLTKQSSTSSASSQNLNQYQLTNKENSSNEGVGCSSTGMYKQRHSDQIDLTQSNSILHSQSIASNSVLSMTTEKPLTAVKKSKKNTNFYKKEIEYYKQREVEYLQRIQKLEKENKRVTQIVQKSDGDLQLLRNEVKTFSHRYNLSNQNGEQSEGHQQKQRVVTPAFTQSQQYNQQQNKVNENQVNVFNIHLSDLQNSDQPMQLSDLQSSNQDKFEEEEYVKNQEKINLLQSYSANLEQKLKLLENNIHSASYQQATGNSKLLQNRDVLNNCHKVLEQKYLSLYQKAKQSKHESDDIQTQIQYYTEELNKLSQTPIVPSNDENLKNNTTQNSVLKALQIGKQLSSFSNQE